MTGVVMAATVGRGRVQAAFGAAGAGATGGAGSFGVSVAYPSGLSGGQLLWLHVVNNDSVSSAGVTTPSGWTNRTGITRADNRCSSQIFTKIADGSESGSLAVVCSGDGLSFGRMYRSTDLIVGVEAAASAITEASATGITPVDVTTTQTLALAIQCIFAAVNTTIGDITGESGADYTEAVAEYAASSVIMSCQVATKASAGAITGGSSTLGAAGTNRCRHGFAIYP